MTQTDEFGEELADFARRVAELKSARSVSGGDLPTVLDAALFELDHVVAQLWPQYERLSARTGSAVLQIRPPDPDALGRYADGAPVLVQANVTSLLCVPVRHDGAVLGVLTLLRCGPRPAFSMAEAQARDMVSRHVALAPATRPRA
ncbi:GAF domain-containing protein [Streptomyces sp. NPDC001617]